MTALAVIIIGTNLYIIGTSIVDWRRNRANRRYANTFLGCHEANRRARQRDDIVIHQQVKL